MSESENTKKRLGDFEIIRELGRGGMGVVYEARQVSLNRKVALKVISSGLGLSSKAVLRFQREAEAAGKLHHTNIVPIYSTGDDDGTHYYAMELIAGPSLQQVIRSMRREQKDDSPAASSHESDRNVSPLHLDLSSVLDELPSWVTDAFARQVDPGSGSSTSTSSLTSSDSSSSLQSGTQYFDTVARMIAEVADALDHAHENGVIHRDIKPANLLLSPDGHLSVNDFGLARMLEQPGMTMSGEFVGSPLYMSPEQITAGRVPLDHRTDIFSLGSTLYELLTLAPPFPGRGRDEVMARILQKDPRRPRSVNKKVPVDLETICLKALEKDPDQRYQTAGQLAEDLRRFINRFEITAKRAGPVRRVVKWARRRPAVAGLLACLIIAAVIGALLARGWYRAERTARFAEGQAALDKALREIFNGRWDEVEPHLERARTLDIAPARIHVLRGFSEFMREDHDTARKELFRALEMSPENLAANALLTRLLNDVEGYSFQIKTTTLSPEYPEDYILGARFLAGYYPDKARAWLELAVEEHPSAVAHYSLGETWAILLENNYDLRDVQKTLDTVEVARRLLKEYRRVEYLYAYAHLLAADVYRVHEDPRHETEIAVSREAIERLHEHEPTWSRTHMARSSFALYRGDWRAALDQLRKGRVWQSRQIQYLYVLGEYETVREELKALRPNRRAYESWALPWALVATEFDGPEAAAASYDDWLALNLANPGSHTNRTCAFEIFSVLGRPADATRRSRQYIAGLKPRKVSAGVPFRAVSDRFVVDDASAEELLGAADSTIYRRWAHYLVGLQRLSHGDRDGALSHFEKIEQSGVFQSNLSFWGVVFLKRLRDDPAWPRWIPVKDPAGASRK